MRCMAKIAVTFLVISLPSTMARSSPLLLNDSEGGATCRYYSLYGELNWHKKLGDWRDKQGVLYGSEPFAQVNVPQQSSLQHLELDVTALVDKWLANPEKNQGFLLKNVRPEHKGIVNFYSRESENQAARPQLVLQLDNGQRHILYPQADTTLDCSSYKSQGLQSFLQVGPNYHSLLRFELPAKLNQLKNAWLHLSSDRQFAAGALIGVFQTEPFFLRSNNQKSLGLAANYSKDHDISRHPAVIFSHGFEDLLWLKEWSDYSLTSSATTVVEDPLQKFVAMDGKALKVTLQQGENKGLDLRYNFADEGYKEPEEIYFRYYLRFGDSWSPTVDGGKLPGIAGTYDQAGWGMRKSDGYNGWSARGGFERQPSDGFFTGVTAVNNYAYHAKMTDPSGERWSWQEDPHSLLKKNQWYSIEQYVKLNTPGKADGVMKAWVDGHLVLNKTDIQYRSTRALKIETIWLDVYHGGTSPSPTDMVLYIDNVVVATKYIGPFPH